MRLEIVRAGNPLTVRAVLAETARESDPAVDTRYDAVDVDRSLRRTLVTVPHGASGKHPAVLLIGGIGCFSVDVASNAQDAYMRLTHDLSRRGFVTMRLEKSGVGDSQGVSCRSVDFTSEAASYGVAFDALRDDPAVDPAHVYVVGHSIGSLIGPRLALQKPVAGLVVAEGVGVDWIEYELLNSRRQEMLGGATPAEVDNAQLLKELCMHRLLVEKQPRETVLREKPECKDYIAYPTGDDYFRQLVTLNVAEPWTKLSIPVLAIYGTADFVTDEADHHRIVDIVNGAHPGNAKLDVIPGMDHYLVNAGSPKASLERSSKGGTRAVRRALQYRGRDVDVRARAMRAGAARRIAGRVKSRRRRPIRLVERNHPGSRGVFLTNRQERQSRRARSPDRTFDLRTRRFHRASKS